jgi:hypothetical protein
MHEICSIYKTTVWLTVLILTQGLHSGAENMNLTQVENFEKWKQHTILRLANLAHVSKPCASIQCFIVAHSTGKKYSKMYCYVLPSYSKSYFLTNIVGGSVGNTLI